MMGDLKGGGGVAGGRHRHAQSVPSRSLGGSRAHSSGPAHARSVPGDSWSPGGVSSTDKVRKPYVITKQRERWTDAEHQLFLEALREHGRAWRKIEEHVGTKTAVQIRSHAQKFFAKLGRDQEGGKNGVPHDLVVPPPRPKRKPAKPYPRKADSAALTEDTPSGGPAPRSPGSDSLHNSGSPAPARAPQHTSSLSPLSAPTPPNLMHSFTHVSSAAGSAIGRAPSGRSSESRLNKLSSVALDGVMGPAGGVASSVVGPGGMQHHAPPMAPPGRTQSSPHPLLAPQLHAPRGGSLYGQQLQQFQQLQLSQHIAQQQSVAVQSLLQAPPLSQQAQAPLASHQLAAVAAVAAAASAAAAAAASAVVASADEVTQALLNANPPNGFPFFGMPPSALAHLASLKPSRQLRAAATLPIPLRANPSGALPPAGLPLRSKVRTGSSGLLSHLHGELLPPASEDARSVLPALESAVPTEAGRSMRSKSVPPLWGQLPLSALLEAAAASSSPKDKHSPPTTSGVLGTGVPMTHAQLFKPAGELAGEVRLASSPPLRRCSDPSDLRAASRGEAVLSLQAGRARTGENDAVVVPQRSSDSGRTHQDHRHGELRRVPDTGSGDHQVPAAAGLDRHSSGSGTTAPLAGKPDPDGANDSGSGAGDSGEGYGSNPNGNGSSDGDLNVEHAPPGEGSYGSEDGHQGKGTSKAPGAYEPGQRAPDPVLCAGKAHAHAHAQAHPHGALQRGELQSLTSAAGRNGLPHASAVKAAAHTMSHWPSAGPEMKIGDGFSSPTKRRSSGAAVSAPVAPSPPTASASGRFCSGSTGAAPPSALAGGAQVQAQAQADLQALFAPLLANGVSATSANPKQQALLEQLLAAQRVQPAALPPPPQQLKQEPQSRPQQVPQASGGGRDAAGGKVRSAFEPVAQQTPPPTFSGRHEEVLTDKMAPLQRPKASRGSLSFPSPISPSPSAVLSGSTAAFKSGVGSTGGASVGGSSVGGSSHASAASDTTAAMGFQPYRCSAGLKRSGSPTALESCVPIKKRSVPILVRQ